LQSELFNFTLILFTALFQPCVCILFVRKATYARLTIILYFTFVYISIVWLRFVNVLLNL